MTPFEIVLLVCGIVMLGAVLSGIVLIITCRDLLSRAVVSDLVFYSMVSIFLTWTLVNSSSIDYEIALLAGLVGGVLPTISMSRIISRGRR